MDRIDKLFKEVERLEKAYKDHFNADIPDKIIGWWDPVTIIGNPDELEAGVKAMTRDVQEAIDTNTPIEEISDEMWKGIMF
ncbi:hypothetical protein ACWN8V_07780 [Vagococcus elongatus]|uniref:Uncharacterized protein n=1 Tax=Vagococcus elongatus TaxID=180344 RepID=A0A430AU16_9ENTE|nr:hypothetical protein [Vagococcus elongatus]RSU11544.1 hypothetical protein CBF29_07630 [Vagococcus elongatus]